MKHSLLWHVAQVLLGLTLWLALIVAVPLAFARDVFLSFVDSPSNRNPL